jgi:hypothetical protein
LIEVFEAWFGDLFDELFNPPLTPWEIAMTIPVRAALYLRVSTGRQADSDLHPGRSGMRRKAQARNP